MRLVQPRNLLQFISKMNLEVTGEISLGPFSPGLTYTSTYFTPRLQVSEAAKSARDAVVDGSFSNARREYSSSLVDKINKSQIELSNPALYHVLQTIVLEAFTLILIQDLAPKVSIWYTEKDARALHENINYAIELLTLQGIDTHNLVMDLRNLDMDTAHMYRAITGEVL